MILVRSIPSVLPALSLLVLFGCSATSALNDSERLARVGDFQRAFEVLDVEHAKQLEAGSVDERLAQAHQAMRIESLRDRAQSLIFREREEAALSELDLLAALDPDNPSLDRLRKAAFTKKAEGIVEGADELMAQKEYVAAMELYIESQRYVPGYKPAEEGINKVREEMARLSARAQEQFLQAVRKVPEFRHIEVAWHAAAVIHLTPDASEAQREDAEAMRATACRESARHTFKEAQECERKNQFGAALVLYKAALLLDPTLTGVDEVVAKMDAELQAVGLLEKAQIAMRNASFDNADALLAEAFGLSELSRGSISEMMMQSRKMKAQHQYREARDLEVMGKKSEALAAYVSLIEEWPDGVEDELARVIGLKIDVEGASAEWAAAEKAEAAGDLAGALEHYIAAERFYAEWRDGEVQIERLRKAIAEKAANQGIGSI